MNWPIGTVIDHRNDGSSIYQSSIGIKNLDNNIELEEAIKEDQNFLDNLTTGLIHDQAFKILELVCEENQNAYMNGYIKGFNDTFKPNLPSDFIEL